MRSISDDTLKYGVKLAKAMSCQGLNMYNRFSIVSSQKFIYKDILKK